MSLSLPLLSFHAVGTGESVLAATLPLLQFASAGGLEEAQPQALIFVQKAPLPKFKGLVQQVKPATRPLAIGTGALHFTIPLLTVASSGSVPVTGTVTLSLPLITWVSSSSAGISATLSAALPLLQFVAVATVPDNGTLGLTLPLLQFNLSEGLTAISGLALTLPRLLWQTTGEVRDLDGSLLGPGLTDGQLFPT